jgi:hypothetical protein
LDKFKLSLSAYKDDNPEAQANFSKEMAKKFEYLMRTTKDNVEIQDLVRCYRQLMDDREQCVRGIGFSTELKGLSSEQPYSSLATVEGVAAMIVDHFRKQSVRQSPMTASYGDVQVRSEGETTGWDVPGVAQGVGASRWSL